MKITDCRQEVQAFAILMEKKLRENDHKSGWKENHPIDLIVRLREETEEIFAFGISLRSAQLRHNECRWAPQQKSSQADEIGKECADVGNFAMMIADVCGALK